jgi:hypothetical protein
MLIFIYSEKSPNIKDMAYDLLSAAEKYGLDRLKLICVETLCSNVLKDNSSHALVLAVKHGACNLKEEALNFITSHATEVAETAGWKEMKCYPSLVSEPFSVLAAKQCPWAHLESALNSSESNYRLRPQSDSMLERHMKTTDEHLKKVASIHQRDWNERLPIFLLAYQASTHETTGMVSANTVCGRESRPPPPQDKEQLTTNYAADLVERLDDIHQYARQRLKLASDSMKARYNRLASSKGFQKNNQVWLFRPTRTRRKSPKLQSSWEGPYKVITRINDVVYRIQRHPTAKMTVVHFDRLAP